ncbi:MAG: type VI-D CRISPR-associated RNA-guided ribonuclease Cas13d [Planctomycetia bacterium]|nr:type VI-D CRISPR-associated RNA-guided ribonuclease Cas13d [Planctomycetia bacterium]
MSKNKKTKAKRMGIKSIFLYKEGRLAIMAFGKGNRAEIAVDADARGEDILLPFQTKHRFRVQNIDENIDVKCGDLESLLTNPATADLEDYLQLKGRLELHFFGRKFPHDNVRIQLIYNILDILKILGLYVNDAIFSVNNLQSEENPQDVVGLAMGEIKPIDCEKEAKVRKILKDMKPLLGFFGDAFLLPAPKPKKGINFEPELSAIEKENLINLHNENVLLILGTLRQRTMHFREGDFFFREDMDKNFTGSDGKKHGNWDAIEKNYGKMINKINVGFIKNSSTNLRILFDIYPQTSEIEITEEYYRFSILKQGRNLGVNMKKLREKIVEKFCPEIKNKKHDSYRSKLYTILDYILFREIRNTDDLVAMVDRLRETSDEEMKEELYNKHANIFWKKIKIQFLTFFEKFKNGFPEFRTDAIDPSYIENVKLNEDGVPFVQLMAFLCNFLDGKEINELLTAFINKFENIHSFIETIEKLGEKVEFTNCTLFNQNGLSLRIANELRVLASIAKMKPDLKDVKRPAYKAAIEMLGVSENSKFLANKWLEKNLLLNESASDEERKSTNPFRNFIVNNVIHSRRFAYLVRYAKPKSVRAVMKNRSIVYYVLSRLPEKQIERYYENIAESLDDATEIPSLQAMINRLGNQLVGFSFDKLNENRHGIVRNSNLSSGNKNVEIERLKALTGLYLTVAYVAIKNLVKINARYYIAFGIFERDYTLFSRGEKGNEKKNPDVEKFCIPFEINGKKCSCELFSLTEYFLEKEGENDYHQQQDQPFDKEACRKHLDSIRRHFTKKWRVIFRQEIDDAKAIHPTGLLVSAVRNHAAHLNVLHALQKYVADFHKIRPDMSSYFELYHFLIQKLFLEEDSLNIPDVHKKRINAGVPSRDLIHVAYVSLGYNLPRYKNLTTEALFDKDSESAKVGEEKKSRK